MDRSKSSCPPSTPLFLQNPPHGPCVLSEVRQTVGQGPWSQRLALGSLKQPRTVWETGEQSFELWKGSVSELGRVSAERSYSETRHTCLLTCWALFSSQQTWQAICSKSISDLDLLTFDICSNVEMFWTSKTAALREPKRQYFWHTLIVEDTAYLMFAFQTCQEYKKWVSLTITSTPHHNAITWVENSENSNVS